MIFLGSGAIALGAGVPAYAHGAAAGTLLLPSMHEERNQDHDGKRNAKQKQQK